MWQRLGRAFAAEPQQGETHEALVKVYPEWRALLRLRLRLANESGVEECPDILELSKSAGCRAHCRCVTLGVRLARLQCHEVYTSGDCRVVATNAIEDVPLSP